MKQTLYQNQWIPRDTVAKDPHELVRISSGIYSDLLTYL